MLMLEKSYGLRGKAFPELRSLTSLDVSYLTLCYRGRGLIAYLRAKL